MNQRLRKAVDLLKDQRKVRSDAECANILGIDKGDLSRFLAGKRPITQRFVGTFTNHFPQINGHWLLTGEGEMIKSQTSTAENGAVSITGEEIKENNIQVNTDETIAKLIAEVAAQRRVTEKVLEQNSELIAIIAGKKKEKNQ